MGTSEIISKQKQAASDFDSGVSNELECPVNPVKLENVTNYIKS